jgi:hypothetical protein
LKNIEVPWRTPFAISNIFNEVDLASAVLSVPRGTKASYLNAYVWKDFGIIEEHD